MRVPVGAAAASTARSRRSRRGRAQGDRRPGDEEGGHGRAPRARHTTSRSSALKAFNPNLRAAEERAPRARSVPRAARRRPSLPPSLDIPDPAIEKFPHSAGGCGSTPSGAARRCGGIARKYDTSPERLMRHQRAAKPRIFPGQTLLLTRRRRRRRRPASRPVGKARSSGKVVQGRARRRKSVRAPARKPAPERSEAAGECPRCFDRSGHSMTPVPR